ncbi:MAG: nuclear transport factor 2 family protein [Pseudomonadota bacterium]
MNTYLKATFLAAGLAAGAGMAHAQSNKEIVLEAFQALFVDFDTDKVASMLTEDYIQHNPAVPTGRAPILGVLPVLQESGLTPTIHRVIAEDDLVALHITYDNAEFFGASTLIAFDIFRVEDGLVAEHWDNLQPEVVETVSGRSMTDGPTEITDLDKTAESKALVLEFIQKVFREGQLDLAPNYLASAPGAYLQHNPTVADGLGELGKALVAKAEAGEGYFFDSLKLTISEGNFVLTVAEGKVGETPSAFYDLWRIEDGLIIEHWDVIQDIPAEMAHAKGKF